MGRVTSCYVLCLIGLVNAASDTCYYPNGTVAPVAWPCDPDAAFSACCSGDDMCLTNGLCRPPDSDPMSANYFRESCTDPDWQADACPKYCYNESTSATAATTNHFVEACSEDTWCCSDLQVYSRGEKFACCDNPLALFNAGPGERLAGPTLATAMFPVTATSTGNVSTSSRTASKSLKATTTSATSLTTAATETNRADRTVLSTGAKAGIGVGAGAEAIIILSLLLTVLRLRRASKKRDAMTAAEAESKAHGHRESSSTPPILQQGYSSNEMSPEAMVVEAPAQHGRTAEMDVLGGTAWELDGRGSGVVRRGRESSS